MNVQHLEVNAGEDRTLTLNARDASNLPVSLAGKTVAFYVGKSPWHPDSPRVLVTKTGTVTDAANGVFTVPVAATDTQYRHGDYEHVSKTTDGSGNVAQVCTGRFRILPSLIP